MEISKAQEEHKDSRPENLKIENDLWVNDSGSIWIPDESDDLHLRLCIIAHTGPSGHRGSTATESTLKSIIFGQHYPRTSRPSPPRAYIVYRQLGGRRYRVRSALLYMVQNQMTSSSLTTLK